MSQRYRIEQMDDIAPVPCPCGQARRGFATDDNTLATLHVTDICAESRVHYHKKLTEIYLVLEGEGHMELDGDTVPLKPLTAVFIRPGCRHRAVGKLRVAITVIPPFDAEDEWFDEEESS